MTSRHEFNFPLHDLRGRPEATDATGIDPDFDRDDAALEREIACLQRNVRW
jgi:hypothetical protein